MPILIGLDYGEKRTGIAVTDPMQMIASGLTTLPTTEVIAFLNDYLQEHAVEKCIVGLPKQMDNSSSAVEPKIQAFIKRLIKALPQLTVERYDERFTSKMAFQTLIDSGVGKKKRREKGLIDKISATLLLQSYLDAQ